MDEVPRRRQQSHPGGSHESRAWVASRGFRLRAPRIWGQIPARQYCRNTRRRRYCGTPRCPRPGSRWSFRGWSVPLCDVPTAVSGARHFRWTLRSLVCPGDAACAGIGGDGVQSRGPDATCASTCNERLQPRRSTLTQLTRARYTWRCGHARCCCDHCTASRRARSSSSIVTGFTRYDTMPGRRLSDGGMWSSAVISTIAVPGDSWRI